TTSTTSIYTLSLHDALPIWVLPCPRLVIVLREQEHRVTYAGRSRTQQVGRSVLGGNGVDCHAVREQLKGGAEAAPSLEYKRSRLDRKSTRLNSSHVSISYAV